MNEAVNATSSLAAALNTYGAWGIVAVLLVAVGALAVAYRAQVDRCQSNDAILNETFRNILVQMHEKHHDAIADVLRELTGLVGDVNGAMAKSVAADDKVERALQTLEHRLERIERGQ